MARVKLKYEPQTQVSVPDAVAATIASLLSLTTDDECLVPGLIVQADPANTDEIYFGGVDAAGAADAAITKSTKLTADMGLVFNADENTGDEDLIVYDLRQFSVLSAVAGMKLNVSLIKINQIAYNR